MAWRQIVRQNACYCVSSLGIRSCSHFSSTAKSIIPGAINKKSNFVAYSAQAITWTNAAVLSNGPLETNFSEI